MICRSFFMVLFAQSVLSHAWPCSAQDVQSGEIARSTDQQDWPWWRGPLRDGSAVGADLPVQFGASENVIWKSPIPGRGHSSPIVVSQRVFLATADEQKQTHSVMAYDIASGEAIWQKQLNQGGFPENNHPKNTEASTTIASNGKLLLATFFHHQKVELFALDLDGQIVWQTDVAPFNPRIYEYGYAPSPVVYENSVIVSAEYEGGSVLVAFDVQQGKELWRTPRAKNISFSSPVVAKIAGRDQLLISGSERVSSYDPTTGVLLWTTPGTTAATCGTMVWSDNLVFASGGYPKAETVAVVADGSGRVAWKNNQKCYEQSMIVVDGYLYGLTDKGVLYCWRADDGKEMWRERLSGPVSASPIYSGSHIYWTNESGTTYVFRPSPERFELAAENRLGNEAFASPAVAANRMLVRIAEGKGRARQEFLVCLGVQ